MVNPQSVRRWILTGGITAITVTGALYGAGLKTEQDAKQERKRRLQAGPEEMIAQLEAARAELVKQKRELERKIEAFSARRLENQKEQEQPEKGAR